MSLFDDLLVEEMHRHSILNEDDMGGAPADGGAMDGEMPAPSMDAGPTPDGGAETEKPVYDKPYQDLATVLYNALRISFEDLEHSAQRKVLALHPDNIKSDEQGVSLFKTIESVLNEVNGPDVDEVNSAYGPGSTV